MVKRKSQKKRSRRKRSQRAGSAPSINVQTDVKNSKQAKCVKKIEIPCPDPDLEKKYNEAQSLYLHNKKRVKIFHNNWRSAEKDKSALQDMIMKRRSALARGQRDQLSDKKFIELLDNKLTSMQYINKKAGEYIGKNPRLATGGQRKKRSQRKRSQRKKRSKKRR